MLAAQPVIVTHGRWDIGLNGRYTERGIKGRLTHVLSTGLAR
jgi:hypothetical protein